METYSTNWKKVDAFDKKGLTASALKEVVSIFNLATAAGNDAQQIKSAMYQMKYRNMVEQNNSENNIFYIDTLVAKAKGVSKNILESMQAELFWSYRRNNAYKLYGRTQLRDEKTNDITTWSIKKLNDRITELYKASLKNTNTLKNTSLKGFDAIIEKGINTADLRPTLFDLLANRALAYFMDEENDVTSPAYKFILDDEKIFSPAEIFTGTRFITNDSSSLYYNALLLFQEILKFHAKDKDPSALIDADLARLAFVNEHAVITNKEKLYEASLLKLETDYSNDPAITQAMYLRAQQYHQQGEKYNASTDTTHQFEIKHAKTVCEEAIRLFPKSIGALNCKNLLIDITAASIALETEKVNTPGQPFKSLLTYKNTGNVYFRVIKSNYEEIKMITNDDDQSSWKQLLKKAPLKSWSLVLPDQQDFQQHSTEIKTEALPAGIYIIIASTKADFNLENNFLARQITYVSSISYISNNKNDLYVLDRDNGQPLAAATVQLWEKNYNYTTRKYEEKKAAKYVTDKTGHVKIATRKNNERDFYFQVMHHGEELFTDDNYYSNYYNSNEKRDTKRTFLFTDRSIYRPGQTVFFKAIIISTDAATRKSMVIEKHKISLVLFDANDQKLSELKLVSNEYGSVNGSFKLPEGSLNGQFSIRDSSTQSFSYFNVEEYKRPKFSVEIKKPNGTYRVNDSIKVSGIAKAYAGNNIDGAKVVYRVVRKVQYPLWWDYGFGRKIWPPYGNREDMEITNGETTSDMNGAFFVNFKAIPDETVNKKDQPVFYYEVSADITDVNGETRSGNTSVAVSYQALQLNIISAEKIPSDSLHNIKISSTNMNDLFEKTSVTLTVQKLLSPDRIFRDRYWSKPDQFVMTKEEFAKDFPYDVYKDENEISKWPLQEVVITSTDTTSENQGFHMKQTSLPAGWYKLTATTKDKYGEEVKAEKYIQVTGKQQSAADQPILLNVKNQTAEPGQTINYDILTGFENIWLIHLLGRSNDSFTITYPTITAARPYSNQIATSENDRGGMNINYAFVKHNRVYNGNQFLSLPWNNKDLAISYETFRDKILPGSEEKWKIKIAGNKSEKVAAETLISMYDASLDQFKPHSWTLLSTLWPTLYNNINWNVNTFASITAEETDNIDKKYADIPAKIYPELVNKGWNELYYGGFYREENMVFANAAPVQAMMDNNYGKGRAGMARREMKQIQSAPPKIAKDEDVSIAFKWSTDSSNVVAQEPKSQNNNNVQVRKNFNETAFFFPSLQADANGNVEFSFTIPEALTTWKMMTLAHTKDLASAYSEKTVITQKPLMVQPNPTRFVREGDRMEFSAKVVNLSDSEITGTAKLELFDAASNKAVDGWFKNIFPDQYFIVAAGQSIAVKFPVEIPSGFGSALTWRIKAASKDGLFTDGEEAALPVLTNRMLVTESMPLNMRNTNSKNFKFEKLITANNSGSLTNQSVTVEYTSNPAWYAVQALPYLMEYPYECAEQSFNRYYANTLAAYVSNSTPKIKAVFEKWLTAAGADTAALLSNLQKNEELKSALLQETPWVLEAQNEHAQKKNIAILFDMVRLSKEKDKTLNKLLEMQSSNGGFAWFKGGPDDRYITQYIITGIGHLQKLHALNNDDYAKIKPIIDKALPYLDARLKEEYDNLKKYKVKLIDNNLSNTAIQYLYMRSFFKENKINNAAQTAFTYYLGQAKKYWLSNSKYMQAMIALSLYRNNDQQTAAAIIQSLKENAINKEELGMYFKEFDNGGYYWYQSPVESQAMIIEAFTDIDKDNNTVDDLKTWLLKQKQTQNWKTTKATAEACYALLLNGSSWLSEEKEVTISLGNTVIRSTDDSAESGTGHFKKTIPGDKVQQGMGNINVSIKTNPTQTAATGTSWGAVYWQYFEDLDKITPAETPMKLVKKLFIEKNSDNGPVLQPLKDGDELHVGDKIKVRIELKADRDMEYIHMKDMRAACMEPVNVISEYKWQGGLGYYESTKDASTNFFFSWLPRGSYVFEYPMFVTHSGNFSNGVTSIQCMYAPEFTSHSDGIRVDVE